MFQVLRLTMMGPSNPTFLILLRSLTIACSSIWRGLYGAPCIDVRATSCMVNFSSLLLLLFFVPLSCFCFFCICPLLHFFFSFKFFVELSCLDVLPSAPHQVH